MKKEKEEGFLFWTIKTLFVAFPLFLAEGVLGFAKSRSNPKLRVLIYFLILPIVVLMIVILRKFSNEMIS